MLRKISLKLLPVELKTFEGYNTDKAGETIRLENISKSNHFLF